MGKGRGKGKRENGVYRRGGAEKYYYFSSSNVVSYVIQCQSHPRVSISLHSYSECHAISSCSI
jgi:hypothetical protein